MQTHLSRVSPCAGKVRVSSRDRGGFSHIAISFDKFARRTINGNLVLVSRGSPARGNFLIKGKGEGGEDVCRACAGYYSARREVRGNTVQRYSSRRYNTLSGEFIYVKHKSERKQRRGERRVAIPRNVNKHL